ncbi:hypothetical protein HF086_007911 [Spodoptera exigua]|nr:hypothetical protein HF086_007911 [Spodoptera exigua]
MKASAYNVYLGVVAAMLALLFVTINAAPMEADEETAENTLVAHPDADMELSGPWDAINTAALRKLLLQLDAEER